MSEAIEIIAYMLVGAPIGWLIGSVAARWHIRRMLSAREERRRTPSPEAQED